jgi:alkylation response protein AidB-like acyl-CoA dehydrogenase
MSTTLRTADRADLQAGTEAGAAMVAQAEVAAEGFVEGAVAHDRDGSFATEHLEELRASGFLFAPVPAELGGGGVTSVRDVLIAMSRLARGDAATTIGVNMHLAVLLNIVRTWEVARALGQTRRADGLAERIRLVVAAGVVFASAASEPSPQDLTRPATTATRSGDGWLINGRKAFATMAPAATILSVALTYQDDVGEDRYGFALVPSGAAGVVFHDEWDALGMRASASGSVSFDDVRVDRHAVTEGFPIGEYSVPLLDRYLTSGAFHAAASLGIAERAHARILATLRSRAAATVEDPHGVVRLAENVVEVTTMRASFDRVGRTIDAYLARHPRGDAPLDEAQEVFAEVQAGKAFLTAAATRVVDRALALSGGSGYLSANPLAKAWRDVRAGGFMHPIGANRADSLLARTALGLPLV